MCLKNIAPFNPIYYGQAFWDSLTELAAIASGYGQRIDYFAGDLQYYFDANSCKQFLERCGAVIPPACFFGGVNEVAQNVPAGFNIGSYGVAGRVLWSRGSPLGDEPPILPFARYFALHTARTEDWERKTGKAIYEAQYDPFPGIPAATIPGDSEEPNGAAEVAQVGRRYNGPNQAFDAAAGASLFCGSCFHYQLGLTAQVPEPNSRQWACAQAWSKGWAVIPLEAMVGQYTRWDVNPNDFPLTTQESMMQRFHGKFYGNGRFVGVAYRPTPDFRFGVKPGWVLDTTVGHGNRPDNVVFLTKV